ncbi:hypothetical protein Poli38472_008966 [Pythium oligandrum]|uniref:Transmembrane protein n=1 Tax=Pythium oligandrum TaxID=41045 RepID=A0A8K1FL22_PYTOL|nr:hypothetical protein Poli38472_008966 [Pythium oligandrum]|eukprot:TMW64799.1 hypothetical protein Poli38472_008966 [Pythium oligandrum]
MPTSELDVAQVQRRMRLPREATLRVHASSPSLPMLNHWINGHLRQSFAHPVSVHVLALASLGLLLSIVLYFLSPILEDDYHIYRQYLPWIYYLDWSQYDSFVVDHVVVFLAISLPMTWLFLLNVAHSHVSSRLDIALLVLRVVCCLVVCFSLTVILTEFLSRRVTIALISLAYGSLGLVYSWSVPAWRWFYEEASTKGLITFLPESIQELLLHTSLLDWLTDTSFMDKMKPFLPFLMPLSKAEQNRVLEQLPVETQVMMTRPGMVALLPPNVQKLLLPAHAHHELTEAMLASLPHDEDSDGEPTVHRLTASTTASAGFDFHVPSESNAVALRNNNDTPVGDDIVSEIMTKRVVRGCLELVKIPSPKALDRTAAVSTALFALQLYASRRSRRVLVGLIQFAVASSLVSVASFAFLVRLVQLMTRPGNGSAALLGHFRQYLIQSWTAKPQLAAHAAPRLDAPTTLTTVRKAATSASAVVAVLFVLRRLRR